MHQRKKLRHGLIERPREARHAGREIEEICRRNHRVVERDVMAAGPLEPRDVPGVLDPPVARRQEKAADQRRAFLVGERLPAFAHDAEPEHPIGMLAAAGQRPASVDPPAADGSLGRPRRLGEPAMITSGPSR